jgi:subtilisin-like proprotein convertase family protein
VQQIMTMTVIADSILQPHCGLPNGYIHLNGYEGVGPFSFTWLPNVSNFVVANNLLPNTYNVTVTSANGCTGTTAITLTDVPSALHTTIAAQFPTCTIANLTATTTGNTSPVSYLWNTGATTTALNNLPQGSYTVTATQTDGCSAVATFAQSGSAPLLPYAPIKDNQPNSPTLDTLLITGYAAGASINNANPIAAVFANLEHSYAGDVKITLKCPTGQIVTLKDNGGGASFLGKANDDLTNIAGIGSTFVWAMTANNTLNNTPPVIDNNNPFVGSNNHNALLDGTYLPDGAFANMNGCPVNGNWIISVSDNADQDDGNLFAWGLQLPSSCTATHNFAKATTSGGNGTPHYAWSDASQLPTLSYAAANNYVVTITDACTQINDTIHIPNPVFGINITATTCNTNSGAATITGLPPLGGWGGSWSNNMTGNTLAGLAMGWYSVTATNGSCTLHRDFYIPDTGNCTATIAGFVVNDIGAPDCIRQTTDVPAANIQISLRNNATNAVQYTFTDANGAYQFKVPTGNYSLTTATDTACYYYYNTCPNSGNINVDVTQPNTRFDDNNFYRSFVPNMPDFGAYITFGNAIPNTTSTYTIHYYYNGNAPLTGATITFEHQGDANNFTAISGGTPIYNATTQTATWTLNTLQPQTHGEIKLSLNIANTTAVVYGKLLANANSLHTFCTLHNTYWQQDSAATIRPNNKQTVSGPLIFPSSGYINNYLRYQIQFQNTTADTAFSVRIRDTLPTTFDISKTRIISSSHPCTITMLSPNILEFHFQNIKLPNAITDPVRSKGFVQFELYTDFPTISRIINTANIQYDYNTPVRTNTLESYVLIIDNTTNIVPNLTATLLPNPANDYTTLEYTLPQGIEATLTLTDALGNHNLSAISNLRNSNTLQIDTHTLPAGIYFVTLHTTLGNLTKKLIIIK